jgi:next to BRCA1 gene 1 protein
MHPDCPDFDLCANCEAHPIAVHPPNHPLLKMVSPDTVVPTVYRVGETQLIQETEPPIKAVPITIINDLPQPSTVNKQPASPEKAPPLPPKPKNNHFFEVLYSNQPVDLVHSDWRFKETDGISPAEFKPSESYTLFQQSPFHNDPFIHATDTNDHLGPIPGLTSSDIQQQINPPFIPPPFEESPLTGGEPLLSRPQVVETSYPKVNLPQRIPTLADLLRSAPSTPYEPSASDTPLDATFLADVTVPDGQVFPPGAEFMKCWRMFNPGDKIWPASTELVHVGGDQLGCSVFELSIPVGAVPAHSNADIWTAELKVWLTSLLHDSFVNKRLFTGARETRAIHELLASHYRDWRTVWGQNLDRVGFIQCMCY